MNDAKRAEVRPNSRVRALHFTVTRTRGSSSLVARTAQAPMTIAENVRAAVWSVDKKDQPVWAVMSLDAIVDAVRAPDRIAICRATPGLFAAIALAIAGVWRLRRDVCSVITRTQEFRIRLASRPPHQASGVRSSCEDARARDDATVGGTGAGGRRGTCCLRSFWSGVGAVRSRRARSCPLALSHAAMAPATRAASQRGAPAMADRSSRSGQNRACDETRRCVPSLRLRPAAAAAGPKPSRGGTARGSTGTGFRRVDVYSIGDRLSLESRPEDRSHRRCHRQLLDGAFGEARTTTTFPAATRTRTIRTYLGTGTSTS